ncbi:MAG: lipopolysaccharide kinase InaA family protein [Planctomycetota bacterium]
MHQVSADYTLAERVSTRIPSPPRPERQSPDWAAWAALLPEPEALTSPAQGDPVVRHRSSWVRRLSTSRGAVYVKTYDYASWVSRLRDFGTRTGPWGRVRAVAEFEALTWLRDHDFAAPSPVAALVWRRCGFVRRAALVTTAFPGAPASEVLPAATAAERIRVAEAIGTLVGRLHALGFRDRNLDLRNLLVDAAADGPRIAKIDSPRFVLRARGNADDALARADWERLGPQLAAFGVLEVARAAAARQR